MIRDNGYQIKTTNYKLLKLAKTILIPEFRSTVIDLEKILNSSRCFRFSCTAVVSDNIKRLVSREAGFCLYSSFKGTKSFILPLSGSNDAISYVVFHVIGLWLNRISNLV